ncbi:hypothetical protein BDV93DRAFT_610112, partial [Ceratobasidium sp. AG-I]
MSTVSRHTISMFRFFSLAVSFCSPDGHLLEATPQFATSYPGTLIPDPSSPLDPTTEFLKPTEPEIPTKPEYHPDSTEDLTKHEREPHTARDVVPSALGFPTHSTSGGGFHFIQGFELEAPGMGELQEWVA